MSAHTLHIRTESPELLIEFELPPGTHASIGASPKAEITLPLTGIPPFSCMIGRFHDGRLYLADLDGTISRRVDLPDVLSIPPYYFRLFHPVEPDPEQNEPVAPSKAQSRSAIASSIRALFRKRGEDAPPEK
jgi:hypothetical protein